MVPFPLSLFPFFLFGDFMYRFPMRKFAPAKTNPYEQLIDSYVNSTSFTRGEKWDSTTYGKLEPEKYSQMELIFNDLSRFLSSVKHDTFDWTKYGYRFPNAKQYVLSKGITVSNKHTHIYPIFNDLAIKLGKKDQIRNILSTQEYVPSGRSNDFYGEKYSNLEVTPQSYKSSYDIESSDFDGDYSDRSMEGNPFVYDSDQWNDYDVYMAYYRTMGIYIPSKYVIEIQETNLKWDRDPKWRWRLVLLIEDPSYGNKHSPSFPIMRGKNYSPQLGPFQWSQGKSGNWDEYEGYQPEGGRTTGGPGYPFGGSQFFPDDIMYSLLTRRSWSILPHLAFFNTINESLKNSLLDAADKYGSGAEEDFKQLGGRGQTDMSEPGKNNFDPSRDYVWNPFRPDFWSYYSSKYKRKKSRRGR